MGGALPRRALGIARLSHWYGTQIRSDRPLIGCGTFAGAAEQGPKLTKEKEIGAERSGSVPFQTFGIR